MVYVHPCLITTLTFICYPSDARYTKVLLTFITVGLRVLSQVYISASLPRLVYGKQYHLIVCPVLVIPVGIVMV